MSSDTCAMGDGGRGTTRLGRRRFRTNFCAKRRMAGPFAHMLHLASNWQARRAACATHRNLAPREICALLVPPTALPVHANIAHPPASMTCRPHRMFHPHICTAPPPPDVSLRQANRPPAFLTFRPPLNSHFKKFHLNPKLYAPARIACGAAHTNCDLHLTHT